VAVRLERRERTEEMLGYVGNAPLTLLHGKFGMARQFLKPPHVTV
jgi:hypothetical protein